MDIPNTYLFTAYYDDGTQYEQGVDDASMQEAGKNAFYDIHYKPIKPESSLNSFRLTEIDGTGTIAVCLRSGAFEINGNVFFQHHEPLKDFRLIYFRVPSIHRTINKAGECTDSASLGYILGWQTNDAKGRKVEKFVKI